MCFLGTNLQRLLVFLEHAYAPLVILNLILLLPIFDYLSTLEFSFLRFQILGPPVTRKISSMTEHCPSLSQLPGKLVLKWPPMSEAFWKSKPLEDCSISSLGNDIFLEYIFGIEWICKEWKVRFWCEGTNVFSKGLVFFLLIYHIL